MVADAARPFTDALLLWRAGDIYEMSDLVLPRGAWTLDTANDINEAGEIVGMGRRGDDVERADIAIPLAPGDLDGSFSVDSNDVTILVGEWGPCSDDCIADLDCDGDVDAADLEVLLANWS